MSGKQKANLWKLGIASMATAIALSVATYVVGQTPSTRPADRTPGERPAERGSERPGERMGERMGERFGGRGGGGGPAARTRLPQTWREATQIERETILNFIRESMPDLAKRLEGAPFGTPPRGRLIALGLKRWRDITRVKEDFPDDQNLVDTLLAQFKSEDEIFDLVEQFIKSPPSGRDAARAKVRDKTREIMTNLFKERERRVAALEEQVRTERARLLEDTQRVESLIDQRVKQLVKEVEQMNADEDKKDGDGSAGPTTAPSSPDAASPAAAIPKS